MSVSHDHAGVPPGPLLSLGLCTAVIAGLVLTAGGVSPHPATALRVAVPDTADPLPDPRPRSGSWQLLGEAGQLAAQARHHGVVVDQVRLTDSVVRFIVEGPRGSVRVLATSGIGPRRAQDATMPLGGGRILQRRDGSMSLVCDGVHLTTDPEARTIARSALTALVGARRVRPGHTLRRVRSSPGR